MAQRSPTSASIAFSEVIRTFNGRNVNNNSMATLRRSDSKPPKEPAPRSCIACTETEIPLVQPCRSCNADYCIDCLENMFVAATLDSSRMPPSCCSLIQIHTILGQLTFDQAKAYRTKFREYITPNKVYCPAPTCSAFIPEHRVPQTSALDTTAAPSLASVLSEVISNVIKSPSARFFRGEMDITQLAGYTKVVKHPVHLGIIQDHLSVSRYKSANELTEDMKLIVTNARDYNGERHPVAIAAEELFSQYLLEISRAMARLLDTASAPPPIFTCQQCHIGVCSTCKQIEHLGSPCDTSAADHEVAMLETFGYKKCPHCGTGVKKMFGCSHMQCLCGAHWCYFCRRAPEQCDGSCEERQLEDDDEDDYDSELDEEDIADIAIFQAVHGRQRTAPSQNTGIRSGETQAANLVVNLDAGGGRRWAGGDYDFGEEPEDEPSKQIWSCHHAFETFKVKPEDGVNRGNLDLMECNRCFERVEAAKPTSKIPHPKKRRRTQVHLALKEGNSVLDESLPAVQASKDAWECIRCRLLVCATCRDKYKADLARKSL